MKIGPRTVGHFDVRHIFDPSMIISCCFLRQKTVRCIILLAFKQRPHSIRSVAANKSVARRVARLNSLPYQITLGAYRGLWKNLNFLCESAAQPAVRDGKMSVDTWEVLSMEVQYKPLLTGSWPVFMPNIYLTSRLRDPSRPFATGKKFHLYLCAL